jgi:hypothetical protein
MGLKADLGAAEGMELVRFVSCAYKPHLVLFVLLVLPLGFCCWLQNDIRLFLSLLGREAKLSSVDEAQKIVLFLLS